MAKNDPNGRTALYRLLAANGRLLYVGIAANPDSRWGGHSTNQPWWNDVADRKVEWFPNRRAAAAAEVAAIKAERPLHNVQHAAKSAQNATKSELEGVFGPRVDWGVRGALAHLEERVGSINDLAAEQSVLGSLLMWPSAFSEVTKVLKAADYYRPAHEIIHRAVVDLHSRGEGVDVIMVVSELAKRGKITHVGGPSYVQTLAKDAPASSMAEYYAEIVHERAVLRRLAETGIRIAHLGFGGEGDVDEIVDAAQGAIMAVAR